MCVFLSEEETELTYIPACSISPSINTLISKSCFFFNSGCASRSPAHPHRPFPIKANSHEIPSSKSSIHPLWSAPYLSLYHYLRLPAECGSFHRRLRSRAAVYKVFRASVLCQRSLANAKQVLGHCCRAFHTDNMLQLNTTPTKHFPWNTHSRHMRTLIREKEKSHTQSCGDNYGYTQ